MGHHETFIIILRNLLGRYLSIQQGGLLDATALFGIRLWLLKKNVERTKNLRFRITKWRRFYLSGKKNIIFLTIAHRRAFSRGWHAFKNMLSYKLNHLGSELLVVDPRYTSQKCSTCGHTKKENRMSQAQFACVQCGHSENADINAAKNVLAAVHAVLSLNPERAFAP